MALKKESSNENKTYIDYIAEQWPTDNTPYFEDKDEGVKSTNVKGVLKEIYGAKTIGKHTVRSMTFVIVDWDGDELHINGSLVQGTKDVFNGLLNNVGNTVAVGIYLNGNKYPTGSVRNEKGDFVDNTFFAFNEIDIDGMWAEIEANHGFFLKEWEDARIFVDAKNAPKNAPKDAEKPSKEEDISVENIPF